MASSAVVLESTVRRKGYPTISRTFDTKLQAETGARATEGSVDQGRLFFELAIETTLRPGMQFKLERA